VTIVNSKLTIQIPKYSAPLPVNRTGSGAKDWPGELGSMCLLPFIKVRF
jgi:hypothetical protein